MIDNKVRYLGQSGHQDHMCWVESLRNCLLSGLPCNGWAHQLTRIKDEPQSLEQQQPLVAKDALELLQTRLKWELRNESTARTGSSLLFYATLANNAEATQLLLQQHGTR